jgi:hypothetical protein
VRVLRFAWRAISSVSTLAWVLSLGIGGVVVTAASRLVSLESPWNLVFFTSVFLIAWALVVPASTLAVSRLQEALRTGWGPATQKRTPGAAAADRDRGAELRTIRTIRGEIDAGIRIVERAVGVEQVYEVVNDANWFAHRNALAAIADAGDGYRLANIAWEGFRTYNDAVKGRRFISNEALEQIARDGRQAVDALGVAADNLR